MNKLLEMIEQKVLLPGGVAMLFVMTLLTTVDTFGRYLFGRPISGSYDITENYLMVATFYCGISYAYRQGANIRITLLVVRIPKGMRVVFNYIVQLLAIGFCSFLSVSSFLCYLPRLSEVLVLTKYNLPLMPVFLLVPIGFSVLTIRMIFDFWRINESGLFKGDEMETSM